MAIRVFLADDHAVVRDGLRLLLEAQADISVVGEAADGRQTVRQIRQSCPDVVVMDIAMPELNGIDAARQIHGFCPSVQIVILSMHASTNISIKQQAGARGIS
jgi:DNA-binding NarL/FixJ family response regulator